MQCQGTKDAILMHYAKEFINGGILQSICLCIHFNASLYACVFACHVCLQTINLMCACISKYFLYYQCKHC